MASLLDIAPLTRKVDIRGQEIEVGGLTAADFAVLLTEHPNIRAVLDGALTKGGGKFDAKHLLTEMPAAAAEIIARGVADKSPGHKALLAAAQAMLAYDSARLLSAIFEVTMPDGIGPFADAVVTLWAGKWGRTTASTEEEKPPLEVLSPDSPPRLSASVVMDSPPKRRGDLRRAS